MKQYLQLTLMSVILTLVGCGYHLVGHGDGSGGAIPADVTMLSLVGNADAQLMLELQQRLQADRYVIVDANSTVKASNTVVEERVVGDGLDTDAAKIVQADEGAHRAMLHVNIAPLVFAPSAFDAAGLATQYLMVFSGSLMLDRQGETIWQSGVIQRQGDVFVTGGPTSIEAARERLQNDLQKQWLSDAAGRVRSGF